VRLAFFGGLYSNYLALEAAIADAKRRDVQKVFCLGDMGAFGPHPDRVVSLLRDADVTCVQGNYDDSIGNELADCQCGYTDPRDNLFAQISYDYTLEKTSPDHRRWLRELPASLDLERSGVRMHLCHGSPRRTNEFLWESTASDAFLDRLIEPTGAEVVLGTHTGLHWTRTTPRGRRFVNVGVLGRPANDGRTNVWYTLVDLSEHRAGAGPGVEVEFVPVEYDFGRLSDEMRQEGLPGEFVTTIESGWWTTCLEVLPSRERRRGRY